MSVGNTISSSSRLLRASSAKAILTLQMVMCMLTIHYHVSLQCLFLWLLLLYLCSYYCYCIYYHGYCYCISAVFVLDTGFHVFVWVGKDATPHEKGGGLVIAHVSSSTVNLS